MSRDPRRPGYILNPDPEWPDHLNRQHARRRRRHQIEAGAATALAILLLILATILL